MTKLSTGTLNKYIYVACKIFFDTIYYYNELLFTNHNINISGKSFNGNIKRSHVNTILIFRGKYKKIHIHFDKNKLIQVYLTLVVFTYKFSKRINLTNSWNIILNHIYEILFIYTHIHPCNL